MFWRHILETKSKKSELFRENNNIDYSELIMLCATIILLLENDCFQKIICSTPCQIIFIEILVSRKCVGLTNTINILFLILNICLFKRSYEKMSS
jgi:hypothetical protein